jgi:hypothetical protein
MKNRINNMQKSILTNGTVLYRISLLFLVMVLCFVQTDKAHAQRALKGMQGIQITGGMVDGFYSNDNKNETGYYFGMAISTYAKHTNKWVFGAEFLNRYYPYKKDRIPVSQFTGEGGYYAKILSDRSKTVFLSLGCSALAGYETSNWGEKMLFDGSTLENEDAFIYGSAITLEAETYLTDRIILLLTARERILGGTTTGHFHTQFGLGLKFIIN